MDEPASRSERPRRRYWVPLLAASGLLIVGAAAQRWRARPAAAAAETAALASARHEYTVCNDASIPPGLNGGDVVAYRTLELGGERGGERGARSGTGGAGAPCCGPRRAAGGAPDEGGLLRGSSP